MLIKCSECGKDVSDKAATCPNCGNPIGQVANTDSQAKICCPNCKSDDVEMMKKGFSGGKAAAGVLLTGGVGILAGVIGSNNIMLGCKRCGKRFNSSESLITFDGSVKVEIDKEIKRIIKENSIVDAVKYYRDRANCSLEQAKTYIDSINLSEKRNGISPGFGCVIIIVLIIFAAIVLSKIFGAQ